MAQIADLSAVLSMKLTGHAELKAQLDAIAEITKKTESYTSANAKALTAYGNEIAQAASHFNTYIQAQQAGGASQRALQSAFESFRRELEPLIATYERLDAAKIKAMSTPQAIGRAVAPTVAANNQQLADLNIFASNYQRLATAATQSQALAQAAAAKTAEAMGAPKAATEALTAAYTRLEATMNAFNAQATAFTTASSAMAAAQVRNAAAQAQQAAAQAAAQAAVPGYIRNIQQLGLSFQGLSNYAAFASGRVGGLLGQMASLAGVVAMQGFSAANAGLIGMAGASAKLVSEMIRVERSLSAVRELHIQIGRVAKEDGVANFGQLTDTMIKYGLSIDALSKPIARLKIATQDTLLGGGRFQTFLEDFAAVSAKFALPQESIAGMAKAFEQMISKGTVQAEEFRQQLGDRLPAAAKVGLAAFQTMTGNASASFSDFMEAMKNRQIESTRFLDIFMTKLKQMFGVTNEAPQNLNAAYGRLSGSYDMMISKMDQAMGVTRAYSALLSSLASTTTTIGNNAAFAGGALAALFGGGSLLAMRSMAAALGPMAGVVATVSGSFGYLRVALAAVGAAAAAFGLGSLLSGLEDTNKKVAGLAGAVPKLRKAFDEAEFKVKFDIVDKDGKGTFSDPANLIAEFNRFKLAFETNREAGTKLKVDFKIVEQFDEEIAKLKAKTYDFQQNIEKAGVPRERNLRASLQKGGMTALRGEIEEIDNLYKVAERALEVHGMRKAAAQTKFNIESIGKLEKYRDEYTAILKQLEAMPVNAAFKPVDTSWLTTFTNLLKTVGPYLQNFGLILGTVAAINFTGLILGLGTIQALFLSMGVPAAAVTAVLLGLAAGMTLFTTKANAAENDVNTFKSRLDELKKMIAETGIEAQAANINLLKLDATARITRMKDELKSLQEAMAGKSSEKSFAQKFFDTVGMGEAVKHLERVNSDVLPLTIQSFDTLQSKSEKLKGDIAAIEGFQRELTEQAKAAVAPAQAQLEIKEKEREVEDKIQKVKDQIKDQNDEIAAQQAAFNTGGLAGLDTYTRMLALKKRFNLEPGDTSFDKQLEEMDRFEQKLKKAREDASRASRSDDRRGTDMMKGYTEGLSKAQGIIASAEAAMDGAGSKIANSLKADQTRIRDYADALRYTGVSAEEAAVKIQQYRVALDMQRAGVNLNNLQFLPLQAMQKGMETWSNSFADLVVTGKLNARSLRESIGDMCRNIAKDILAMSIRVAIVRPIMQSMFGTGMFGGSGLDTSSAATAGGNWATSIFPAATAKPMGASFDAGGSVTSYARAENGGSVTAPVTVHIAGNVGSPEYQQLRVELPQLIENQMRVARRTGRV